MAFVSFTHSHLFLEMLSDLNPAQSRMPFSGPAYTHVEIYGDVIVEDILINKDFLDFSCDATVME
jgi:hypothetical protein